MFLCKLNLFVTVAVHLTWLFVFCIVLKQGLKDGVVSSYPQRVPHIHPGGKGRKRAVLWQTAVFLYHSASMSTDSCQLLLPSPVLSWHRDTQACKKKKHTLSQRGASKFKLFVWSIAGFMCFTHMLPLSLIFLSKSWEHWVSATHEMSDLVIVHLAAQAWGSLRYQWTSCHIWAEKQVSGEWREKNRDNRQATAKKGMFLKNKSMEIIGHGEGMKERGWVQDQFGIWVEAFQFWRLRVVLVFGRWRTKREKENRKKKRWKGWGGKAPINVIRIQALESHWQYVTSYYKPWANIAL